MSRPFVLVAHPSLAVDLARSVGRLAIAKNGFLCTIVDVRFVKTPLLALPETHALRPSPDANMAHLRKVTGQDWRGRR